jgi:hypothetical protein
MNYTEEQTRNMSYEKKYDLAGNPNTPVGVLEALAKDTISGIRWEVAGNTNTPVELLKVLSKDKDPEVRQEVAENHNTPVDVLAELSKDEDGGVRWRVAENPKSTDQILVRLFETERRQKDRDVLEAIVKNSNCPGYLKAVIQTKLEGK